MTCSTHRLRPFIALALCLAAGRGRADRLFVGVLEADSYQSVIYGASAFSRIADLPAVLEMINAELSKSLLLPSFTCLASGDLLRVVQTVDPALPRSADNPANVALIPLSGDVAGVHSLFAATYGTRRESGPFTCYEQPAKTNVAPRVFLAVSGKHLLTSASEGALAWAWSNRSHLIDAPAQNIPGTLRVLVNPQRFADLISVRGEQTAALFNVDRLLRDMETCLFSISLDGQAVALAMRGKPHAGTPLHAFAAALRKPQERLWNGLPDNAFFASLAACDDNRQWDAYLGEFRFRLLQPVADLAPPAAFGSERLLYLSPSKDLKGLCLVHIMPVTEPAAVREALRKLDTVNKGDGVFLKREPSRTSGPVPIETYSVSLRPPAPADGVKPEEPSMLFTLMSLFLKKAYLETAVTDGFLITVLGPAHSLENEVANLRFSDKALTLNRKVRGQDLSLNDSLCAAATLNLVSLLRQIITIMPGAKPEHLRVLPVGGNGASFGVCQVEEGSLLASLRVQTSELAALQRINRDGRAVLQELILQMFEEQMLNLQAAPPKKAAP